MIINNLAAARAHATNSKMAWRDDATPKWINRLADEVERLRATNLGLDHDLAQARCDLGDARAEIERLRGTGRAQELGKQNVQLRLANEQLREQRATALALIDDLMRQQYVKGDEWTRGVKWRTDVWQRMVARRAALGAADEPTTPEIRDEDLQVDRYFAADQPVNQNARGVSLTHLPTQLTVSVHSERTALQNEVLALAKLRRVIAERAAAEPTTGGSDG